MVNPEERLDAARALQCPKSPVEGAFGVCEVGAFVLRVVSTVLLVFSCGL